MEEFIDLPADMFIQGIKNEYQNKLAPENIIIDKIEWLPTGIRIWFKHDSKE